jgi:hypothetical protein
MPIAEFEPAPQLATHIASYWGMSAPAGMRADSLQSLPPDGCITLVSQRTPKGDVRAALVGPRSEPFQLPLRPGDRVWAVRFWPDAGGVVLDTDPRRLAGHFVSPLSDPPWALYLLRSLAGCRDEEAACRVANEQLAAPVAAAASLDAAIRMAVQALIVTHGEMSIADVADGVGLSLRQLERRFLAVVGLNPIQFARIRRMRGDLGPLLGAGPATWNAVAPELAVARP